MGFRDRSRLGRSQLAVELLEDRTTPTKLDGFANLALPDLVAAGAVSGDHVNVVMTATSTNAADTAKLAATPFASNVRALGFGIYSVTLTPNTDLGGAITYYSSLPGVVSAAPDQIISVQQIPNDPSYGSLYGMTKISAPAAWDKTTGSSKFVVAVIDSGVDYRHRDLYQNIWINQTEIPTTVRPLLTDVDGDGLITFRDLNNAVNIGTGKITDLNANGYIDGGDLLKTTAQGGWANGSDGGGNGYIDDLVGWNFVSNTNDPFDDNNHGTHVSGTIAAVGNNAVGVAGVNWSAQVMGLKFLAASGSGSLSAAVNALNYAVTQGVKLSNNSWGGGGYDPTMAAALGRAQTAGHVFVAAAGNSAQNIDLTASYPASYIQTYTNVVTVAATDSNDALASFSNYGGTSVTLAAPGVGTLSTTPNNTYSSFSGTSMATPHVVGALALAWSYNPTLTYTQLINNLKSSVDPVAGLAGKVSTGGRLNVDKLLTASSPGNPTGPKVLTAAYSGATATQFDKVLITFDKAVNANTFTTADVASFTGPTGALAVTGVTPVGTAGTQFNITFAPQTAPGTYSLKFGPIIVGTNGQLMDQNGNGTGGEATDAYTATGSLSVTTTRTYSSTGAVAIRDLATNVSTITVPDNLTIADLNVKVNITHTWDSDLVITLTSPAVGTTAGKTVTLFNRRGGSGDNLTNTVFDDEAALAIATGTAPFANSYKIEVATGNLLSAFDGLNAKGTWTLTVKDMAAGDVGTLNSWSITATGALSGAGGASVQALGFRDEPTVAAGTTFEFDAAPVAVTSSQPRESAARPFEIDYRGASTSAAPTGSARSVSWMSPSEESRGSATRSESGTSYTNRDARDARRAAQSDDSSAPRTPALAALYFAPEASASDALSTLLGDAE